MRASGISTTARGVRLGALLSAALAAVPWLSTCQIWTPVTSCAKTVDAYCAEVDELGFTACEGVRDWSEVCADLVGTEVGGACDRYNFRTQGHPELGQTWFYDAQSGALVAILETGADDTQPRCVAGPTDFVAPQSCEGPSVFSGPIDCDASPAADAAADGPSDGQSESMADHYDLPLPSSFREPGK